MSPKLNKKKRILVIAALSTVLWAVIIYLVTRESQEARIMRSGGDAVATIVSLEDQHETLHDSRALMRVKLEGLRDGSRFEATVDRRMTEAELATYVPGARVAIRYDRKSPEDVVILRLAGATGAQHDGAVDAGEPPRG